VQYVVTHTIRQTATAVLLDSWVNNIGQNVVPAYRHTKLNLNELIM